MKNCVKRVNNRLKIILFTTVAVFYTQKNYKSINIWSYFMQTKQKCICHQAPLPYNQNKAFPTKIPPF